jgi:hypothetical protein
MKKVRIITGVLTAALIAASFAGCGEKVATQDASASKQEQEQSQNATQGQRGMMAKVVSLDGDQLTVVLSDRPDRVGDGSTPPAMSTPPDNGAAPGDGQAPTDGSNPPTPPSGSGSSSGPAINGSGGPAGGPGQPGQGGGKLEFTGKQVTYTLSGDVSVMKGTGDSAAEIDLSELKADDVIRFTTVTDDSGNETIDAINVLE